MRKFFRKARRFVRDYRGLFLIGAIMLALTVLSFCARDARAETAIATPSALCTAEGAGHLFAVLQERRPTEADVQGTSILTDCIRITRPVPFVVLGVSAEPGHGQAKDFEGDVMVVLILDITEYPQLRAEKPTFFYAIVWPGKDTTYQPPRRMSL